MTSGPATTIVMAVHDAIAAGDRLAVAAALHCVDPDDLATFFHTSLAVEVTAPPIGEGLPASPGAAGGRIVLTADDAVAAGDRGEAVILLRSETTPDDVLGMQAARGVLTVRGGLVSHAAVVARGWGIPAVVGASEIVIDGDTITIGAERLVVGDEITIDGSTGAIHRGALATASAEPPPELDTLLAWADVVAAGHVEVRANADTEGDATRGREHGAQGIGLCRTEHMFLAADRLPIMRRFILSDDPDTVARALAELEHAQVADFETVLDAMDGLPVTVRLLDPPLHEFLPDLIDLSAKAARDELSPEEAVAFGAARRLHESNPMIGTRGVRLGVVRSGLYEMQVRALCTAAANLFERGRRPHVEIMIPLVVDAEELRLARSWVTGVLDEIGHPELAADVITVGAMIETPRAALTAGALAEYADFFSFGTNDLTQLTYAFSRDDVEARLLPAYLAHGILPANPFAELDEAGVGELVRIACEATRASSPSTKLGACGEHAGHPASTHFLVRLGVDSVSCSPFRVPLARLAVAQALLACGRAKVDDLDLDRLRVIANERRATSGDDAALATTSTAPSTRSSVAIEIDEAIVLHTLRVRGFVTADGFAETLGEHPAAILGDLVAAGLVRHVETRDMYGLLPIGKDRHAELLDSIAPPDTAAALHRPYERFLLLNDRFKALCTTWQVRDGVPNDHADAEYDARCTGELAELSSDAQPVIAEMEGVMPRLGRYAGRLSVAAACVANGDAKRFTGVMCESFHDVWMELHEDLIVVQRIDRVAEGSF